MKTCRVVLLALGFALLGQPFTVVDAARKYYPPGFKPPTDQNVGAPATAPPKSEPQPQVIIQQMPGAKQVIIKTVPVPVTVKVPKPVPAKPKDPLLVLIDNHRYYDALRLVDTRLKKSPNNTGLLLLRGKILREDGNYEQAIAQFQALQDKGHSQSVKASAWNGIGWTYYQKALHDKKVGDTEAFKKSLESAEGAFKQAAQQLPNLPYPWAGLGRAYLADGRVKEAGQAVKKAIRLAPNNLTVQLADADLMLAQNKPEDALQMLYGIKKTTTNEPDVFLLLARASLETGKTDDAIINLKQLLELVPDHTEALKLLSQSYERKMKPEDAEEVLEKAIALNPTDVRSVESLLAIYGQRGENERGILLLKTLLKNKPEQVVYAQALLSRLNDAGRWDESYQEGLNLIGPVLSAADSEDATEPLKLVSLFAEATYQKGRGMLDRRTLLVEPAVQSAKQFTWAHLQNLLKAGNAAPEATSDAALNDRLTLLYLDPLTPLPALPQNFQPTESALPKAIQMAFLAGDLSLHDKLLSRAKRSADNLEIARQLYNIGDYAGAKVIAEQVLAQTPTSFEAKDLSENIAESQKEISDQMAILSLLPRKISNTYWQKAVSEALRIGSGDWKTHAMLANVLEKRRQPELALFHQRMAAHYAPNAKDKDYWQRKADKTARALPTSAQGVH
jgi:cytochrome c-type biogenesis protein CcmH/NrfG